MEKVNPITNNVKFCPFCGSNNTYVGHVKSMTFAGQCLDCTSCGPKFDYDFAQQHKIKYNSLYQLNNILQNKALEAWNKRK